MWLKAFLCPKFRSKSALYLALTAASSLSQYVNAQDRRVNTAQGRARLASATEQSELAVSAAQKLCRVPLNCAAWQHLIDPKKPEFWKEGNHLPDEGYIRLFQEMTPDAAKIFLLRGEIKALYMERASALLDQASRELISAGLMRDRYNVMSSKAPVQIAQRQAPKPDADALKALQYFFIFSPTCPICKQQSQSLVGFPNVYPLQVDQGKLFNFPALNPSDHASKETIAKYAPDQSVPVLVIYKTKGNKSVVLKGGPLTSEQILLASAELLRSK